jgi:hypothetical protein
MIAAIAVGALVVVGLVAVVLIRRRPAANIVIARKLAHADGPAPGMDLAANAANQSRSVAAAADRLGHFAVAAVKPPGASKAPAARRDNCAPFAAALAGWRAGPARSAA